MSGHGTGPRIRRLFRSTSERETLILKSEPTREDGIGDTRLGPVEFYLAEKTARRKDNIGSNASSCQRITSTTVTE